MVWTIELRCRKVCLVKKNCINHRQKNANIIQHRRRHTAEVAFLLPHIATHHIVHTFLRATAHSAKRVLAIVILSVCLSQPCADSSPGKIERLQASPYDGFSWANFVPLGEEIPLERGHQKGVPHKNLYFTVISSASVRTVADRGRFAAYHNKHCWRLFWGYQHWWP